MCCLRADTRDLLRFPMLKCIFGARRGRQEPDKCHSSFLASIKINVSIRKSLPRRNFNGAPCLPTALRGHTIFCPTQISPSPSIESLITEMLLRHLRIATSRPATSRLPASIASPTLRTYAQPASAPDSKPPVALYGLDGTYASALVRRNLDPARRDVAITLLQLRGRRRKLTIMAPVHRSSEDLSSRQHFQVTGGAL